MREKLSGLSFALIYGEAVKCHPGAHKRTRHAEAEDALVLLHQPLQQRALPRSGGAAQHHGSRSRHASGIGRVKCDET